MIRRTCAAALLAAFAAACGASASPPARIEATPAVKQTTLPSATRAPSNYEGY